MLRFSFVLALLGTTTTPAAGQLMERLPCADGDFYAPCALTAGRLPDLRAMWFREGEREIRFAAQFGMDSRTYVLVIHQRHDVVTGQLLTGMAANWQGSDWVSANCVRGHWARYQGICTRRLLGEEPNWARLLHQLDSLGIAELPSRAAPPFPPDTTPLPPTRPGMLPVDRLVSIATDGPMYTVEFRTGELFWRYVVPSMPDSTANASKRDAAIVRVLRCAIAKFGGIACNPNGTR